MTVRSTRSLSCFCSRTFSSPIDLDEHRTARGHFPSHICRDVCKHPPVPRFDFQVRKCGQCGKICEHSGILEDHRIATGHYFFAECNLPHEIQHSQESPKQNKAHASEFRCCDCDQTFLDIHALNAHVKKHPKVKLTKKKESKKSAEAKKTVAKVKEKQKCKICNRKFQSPQALQQHCNSVKHKPLSALTCPMSKRCPGKFAAPSALLHHLESGKCRSGIDRDDIYHQIQLHDKDKRIHNIPTLTPSTSTASPLHSHTPPLQTTVEMSIEWSQALSRLPSNIAQDRCYMGSVSQGMSPLAKGSVNGVGAASALQCPFCPKTSKKFATKQALQQHIESPAHGDKLYHCPISTDRISAGQVKKQRKDFTTLAGLAQHLESGACNGGKSTFLYYVDLIQRQMDRWGFGGVRLLLPGSAAH